MRDKLEEHESTKTCFGEVTKGLRCRGVYCRLQKKILFEVKLEKMSLAATAQYGSLLMDYLADRPALRSFYGYRPSIEGLDKQIQLRRSFSIEQRRQLQTTLREQYKGLPLCTAVSKNIDALSEAKTFVITTGQQLNLCLGPLYTVFKIVTAIATARRLQRAKPNYHFVPLFWMQSEDHDLSEINQLYFQEKYYSAKLTRSGAVGQLPTDLVAEVLKKTTSPHSLSKCLCAST